MSTKPEGFLERTFKLRDHNSNIRTEAIAGLTTFMTMAYILIVNPIVLGQAGMDMERVFTATALSSLIGTLVMALLANLPFALAPGMGLNAFFTFSVVMGLGKSFQFALTAVFLEGILFILLSFVNVREMIVNSIPESIKKAISVGIGLFIAFIGLSNAGIVTNTGATPLSLGTITSGTGLLALIGLAIAAILLALRVKGALFLAIIATTLIGIPMNITQFPDNLLRLPAAPYFFDFEWSQIFSWDMLIVMLTFLFVDIFDTVGTLVGVATKANMLSADGKVPRAKQALLADAIATTAGAALGTSTVTTYVESAAGVAEGGRTGLSAMVTALLFGASLLLSPLFIMIPGAATAPALILVGFFMASPIKEINFDDFTEAIPAFLTLLMMPLSYSISEGIMFGIIAYTVLKLFTGRIKEAPLMTIFLAILFVVKFYFG